MKRTFDIIYDNNNIGTFDSIKKGLKALKIAFDDDFNFTIFKESYKDCLKEGGEEFENFKDVCSNWNIIIKE